MSTKIRVHDLGPQRWHMTIRFDNIYTNEVNFDFKQWMHENYPDCLCIHRFNNGDPYWELRGGDPADQAFIAMRWGGDN
jgi:hypothetical protein